MLMLKIMMELALIVTVVIIASACGGARLTTTTTATTGATTSPGLSVGAGKLAYDNNCIKCHRDAGPAGLGAHLGGYQTAAGLLGYISANMPPGEPGSLSRQEYMDIVKYLLVENNHIQANTALDESQLQNLILK